MQWSYHLRSTILATTSKFKMAVEIGVFRLIREALYFFSLILAPITPESSMNFCGSFKLTCQLFTSFLINSNWNILINLWKTTKGSHTHFTNLACNIPTENFFAFLVCLELFLLFFGIPGPSREFFGNSRKILGIPEGIPWISYLGFREFHQNIKQTIFINTVFKSKRTSEIG